MEEILRGKIPSAAGGEEPLELPALEELYRQRVGALVEVRGQVSNLQRMRTSSGRMVGFFVLFDYSAFVHVFVPWHKLAGLAEEMEDGKKVVVRGRVVTVKRSSSTVRSFTRG